VARSVPGLVARGTGQPCAPDRWPPSTELGLQVYSPAPNCGVSRGLAFVFPLRRRVTAEFAPQGIRRSYGAVL